MKKSVWFFLLTMAVASFTHAQVTNESDYETAPAIAVAVNPQPTSTGVVIIDDDELGVTISPNPANTYITVNSTKDLSTKTFSLFNGSGAGVLQKKLTSTTITVSSLNSGTYSWTITDTQNKKLASGTLIIQH